MYHIGLIYTAIRSPVWEGLSYQGANEAYAILLPVATYISQNGPFSLLMHILLTHNSQLLVGAEVLDIFASCNLGTFSPTDEVLKVYPGTNWLFLVQQKPKFDIPWYKTTTYCMVRPKLICQFCIICFFLFSVLLNPAFDIFRVFPCKISAKCRIKLAQNSNFDRRLSKNHELVFWAFLLLSQFRREQTQVLCLPARS